MLLLKITPRLVWRTSIRCRFYRVPRRITLGLSSGVEQCHRPLVHSIDCPVYYSTDRYRVRPLQSRNKIHKPDLYSVCKLSSSKKPLLFTDDLLQKHIKQLIAEWNQIQSHLNCDPSYIGQLLTQDTSKRQHYLQPIVSKITQHQQYSADISELEDIISSMFCFFRDYFISRVTF